MRTVMAAERRARLARRHALAPGQQHRSVERATEALTVLHATDLPTVYLSARARVVGLTGEDVTAALETRRTLVRQLAMRRTLFVVPRDRLAVVVAAAGLRVAGSERRRLARVVERAGLHADGSGWIDEAAGAVLEHLRGGHAATWTQLRDELPILAGRIRYGEGRAWQGESPVGAGILTILSAEGRLIRGGNAGSWLSPKPEWVRTEDWLGAPLPVVDPDEARRDLVHAWLGAFGPGTERDIVWWLGDTRTNVRRALRDIAAVAVDLDGEPGWLLPADVEPEPPVDPWAALLPALDPTTMGWQQRDWYLGPHRSEIFDSAGNGGTTAWWDGRIVGGWGQDPGGRVVLHLLEDVGPDGRSALGQHAAELAEWLGGERPAARWPSPLLARVRRSGAGS